MTTEPRSRWPASLAAIAALCVLSAGFFWKVVLLHQALLPADVLFSHDPLWRPFVPHGFSAPSNPLNSDALTEFYPWTALSAHALHHGTLPLWNPYSFSGTPFLAAMQPAVFYPVNLLLEWFLAPIDVLGWRAIIHLAVALVGTFCFARRLGLTRPAALIAALAFGLSAPVVVWLEHPISGAIAWLPLLLLTVDGVITGRNRVGWTVATAAVLAIEFLAGHGESSAHVLLLCGTYAIFRVTLSRRGHAGPSPLRSLGLLAMALAVGIGMAAAHLLPVLAQIPLSEAAFDRALTSPANALGDLDSWRALAVSLVPDFFGNPAWNVSLLPGSLTFNEAALYTGAVPLLLAVLAALRRREPHVWFFVGVALVALAVAARLPLVSLFNNLPLLRVTSNGRLRIEYAFAIAILAGFGLDAVSHEVMRTAWRLARVWWCGTAILVALGVIGLLSAHVPGRELVFATIVSIGLPLLWIGLFASAMWLWWREKIPRWGLIWSVVLMTTADLFSYGIGYHTTVDRAIALATPPAVHAIARDHSLYRVIGLGEALMPAMSSLYGLSDVRGYDPAYNLAYEQYFHALLQAKPGMRLGLRAAPPTADLMRAFNLMNVKYIVADCDVAMGPPLRPVYRGAGCAYLNPSAMPRAVLAHRVVWADPPRALVLLSQGLVDPRNTALLDPATVGRRWRVSGQAGRESVRVSRYDLNLVALTVRSETGGVLVLTDAFAPGWSAHIDGLAAPIARADGAFRAVLVGPGTHNVTFVYEPDGFTLGLIISAISGAILLALSVAALWQTIGARRIILNSPLETIVVR